MNTPKSFFMPDIKIQVSSIKSVRLLEASEVLPALMDIATPARVCIDVIGGVTQVYTGEDAALSILALQECEYLTKDEAAAMQKRFYYYNRGEK